MITVSASALEPTPPTPTGPGGEGGAVVRPQRPASVVGPGSERPTATTQPEVPSAAGDPAAAGGSDGVALPVVGLGLIVALAIGLAVGYVVRLLTAPPSGSSAPDPVARPAATPPFPDRMVDAPAPVRAAEAAAAEAQGRATALAGALVEVRDRVANRAISDRIGAALDAAGWRTVDPTGEPFDPDVHLAVDRELSDDADLDRTVAATERVGYIDERGAVVRLPEVVVFHHRAVDADGTRSAE